MEQQDKSLSADAPIVQDATISNQLAGVETFKEGLALLRGMGVQQDFAMASARLLDAADLQHPTAFYFCALLYFCGVGVSRNTQFATDYAERYLEADPEGAFRVSAKDIIDGTLSAENAKKLLMEKPSRPKPSVSNPIDQPKSKKNTILLLAVGLPVVLITLLAVFALSKGGSASAPESISGIKLESLISKEEVDQARKDALSIAANLQADAQVVMQQQKAAQETQAKVEEEQKTANEARAKVEAEQKVAQDVRAKAEQEQKVAQDARAKVEQEQKAAQDARARDDQAQRSAKDTRIQSEFERLRVETENRYANTRQTQSSTSRQTAMMLSSARDVARQGEFDRANGILDSLLAVDPSNQEAKLLQFTIRQARSRAVNNLQIR